MPENAILFWQLHPKKSTVSLQKALQSAINAYFSLETGKQDLDIYPERYISKQVIVNQSVCKLILTFKFFGK